MIYKTNIIVFLLFGLAAASVGCQSLAAAVGSDEAPKAGFEQAAMDTDPEKINRKVTILATQLFSNLKQYSQENNAIVVTTFVDLDSFGSTNRFGRYISERLVYVLHKMGFQVFEIRQSKWIKVVKGRGEFHLTRNARELLNKYRSDAVVVGTYLRVNDKLTLHLRMLDRDTSRIVSVASMNFNLSEDHYLQKLISREDTGIDVSTALMPLEE